VCKKKPNETVLNRILKSTKSTKFRASLSYKKIGENMYRKGYAEILNVKNKIMLEIQSMKV
jgi:hypothetical protein